MTHKETRKKLEEILDRVRFNSRLKVRDQATEDLEALLHQSLIDELNLLKTKKVKGAELVEMKRIDNRIKELLKEQKDASGSPGMPAKDVKMHHTPNTSQNRTEEWYEGGGGGAGATPNTSKEKE